ncbi:ribonuclease H-like domain-containing protein [Caldalkalibacillus thermarum TA2.A1]|uniref:Ribonuclease H-like domain-containing protein n=1 Tax=Caldalkalibacillus thermarum (strain TA2.A1) TaxID=986075 RepID=A0A8X8IB43_CALTT|nr:ribonuclease H-like domain-containing protein [Caldalkalibacillus thermarum]QZT34205.1 ribonuclease H-like domain-containing protein [Caldalkalibacillus thermarum TA2.A1]
MSLKGKLNRLKSHLTVEKQHPAKTGQPNVQTTQPTLHDAGHKLEAGQPDIPHRENWARFNTHPYVLDDEYALVRTVTYPLDYRHGLYRLGELKEVVQQWNDLAFSHPLSTFNRGEQSEGEPRAQSLEAEDLLFFDTETTGLGSGTGNTIFLLGYARLKRDHVHITQFFLPGPSHEAAFYHGFLQDVRDLKNLVTYNGKAFDWPQVKTRHTFVRERVPKLPRFGHFDLLHAARRLWKQELHSCRLAVIEEHKLSIRRERDTAGYLAPMLYFDYLQDPCPETIKGVFRHNEWDVLSLISLYIHLSSLVLERQTSTAEEKVELGRWLEQLGQEEPAQNCYEELLASLSAGHHLYVPVAHQLASLYKKPGNYEKALELWESLPVDNHPYGLEILIECAKLYEHKLQDVEKALFYARQAYARWKQHKRLPGHAPRQAEADLVKRINRLEKKMKGKQACDIDEGPTLFSYAEF